MEGVLCLATATRRVNIFILIEPINGKREKKERERRR
jgi:hypothetical protein